MGMMDLRRKMMGVIASMAGANFKTGTFTPDTDITEKTIDFGVPISSVKMVVLHMENITSLASIPNSTTIDIFTIVEPAYTLNAYAGVIPYQSCEFYKNVSGTLAGTLHTRSNYSVGQTYGETTKWTFRGNQSGVCFRANYTYRWTAYLN